MLKLAGVFFALSIVAALFHKFKIALGMVGLAQTVFYVFVFLTVVTGATGLYQKRTDELP